MIDAHCHLDLYPDPAAVAKAAAERGIYILSVTTTPKAWRGTKAIAKDYPRIQTALGLHPQLAHERRREMALFEGLLPEAKYVGEIGLDGSPEFKVHWDDQIYVFDRALKAVTKAGGRIMSLHSRRASDEVLDMLDKYPNAGVAILHWFSGTKKQLQRANDMGCWFSVGPAMLRSKAGAALAAAMPRNRVLTETDGPFAMRGNHALLPTDVYDAIPMLAKIWDVDNTVVEHGVHDAIRTLAAIQLGAHH